MSLVGDVAELERDTIVATATHPLTGSSGHFHFSLSSAPGIAEYFRSHAKVSIIGPVQASIAGPVSTTAASTATIAVVPDKYDDWPEAERDIVELQGSIRVQHSLLLGSQVVPLPFGNETAEQLKPPTLVDFPPVIVGYYEIAGGKASTSSFVVLRVPLRVSGVAHQKTWK